MGDGLKVNDIAKCKDKGAMLDCKFSTKNREYIAWVYEPGYHKGGVGYSLSG